jgi:hypothetical protein
LETSIQIHYNKQSASQSLSQLNQESCLPLRRNRVGRRFVK